MPNSFFNTTPRRRSRCLALLLITLAIHLVAHLALRVRLSESLHADEADLVLFSQFLAGGYSEQPPLYCWLVWGAFQVLGMGVFALSLVKGLILSTMHVFLFLVARRVQRDERLALLATLSPLVIPTFSWHAVAYLTHTLLACALGYATLELLLRMRQSANWWSYITLGFVLGLGVLSKYNYLIFATGLLAAALTIPAYRVRLLNRRLLLTAMIVVLVTGPHAVWLADNFETVREAVARKTGADGQVGVAGIGRGVGQLGINTVLIIAPWALGFLAFLAPRFRWVFMARTNLPERMPGEAADARRLLGRFFLTAGLLLLLQIVAGGATQMHERWLQPFALLVPVYVFAWVDPTAVPARRQARFAGLLAVAAVVVFACRAAQIWIGGNDRALYPIQMALAKPAAELQAAGLDGATFVVADREIGGNLRLCLPRTRFYCFGHPGFRAPLAAAEGPCYLAWNTFIGDKPPTTLRAFGHEVLGRSCSASTALIIIEVPPILPNRRTNRIALLRVN